MSHTIIVCGLTEWEKEMMKDKGKCRACMYNDSYFDRKEYVQFCGKTIRGGMMSEKRFIRNIEGNIYDMKNHKFIKEDWKGKHLDYDDDLVVLLNELAEENEKLKKKLYIVETDCKNVKESRNHYRKENELLKQDNQRQKTLRNKHWREIQARANAYNRIISSLEDIIPQPMIEELRNAPLLDCDYEGVESNE